MASALPSTFRRAWSEFSLRFRVMTELSPPTLNFLTMFATVPMLIPCDLAQSACFKTGGWASSKSSNILHLLARVSFVDLLRSILLSNETSSSDRLTEYDFGLAIVASPLVAILGVQVFAVYLWGMSGSGKTPSLKAAGSVWGDSTEGADSYYGVRGWRGVLRV